MDEYNAKFDDDHQMHFYCVGILDGDGEDDRRTARICHHQNWTAMNAVRMQGHKVEDRFYHDEAHYMPPHWKSDRRQKLRQSWDEMRSNLGF